MLRSRRRDCLLAGILVVSLLLGPVQLPVTYAAPPGPAATVQPAYGGLYRAQVRVGSPARRARLDQLEVVVLSEGPDWAAVLVDADQLATLARLRFEPRASDDLAALTTAAGPDKSWLTDSLRPLLTQAQAVQQQGAIAQAANTAALRASMKALSAQQAAGLAALTSVDEDGDGLTNTQELWWCTDPSNPYTRDDPDKTGGGILNDGEYVRRLLQYVYHPEQGDNRRGVPFAGWPMVPGDGHFKPNCLDGDWDSVPDQIELYVIGSNPNRESTSADHYDDGQKLFGITVVAPTWGELPLEGEPAEMPGTNLVKWPGRSIFAAAFAKPEIQIAPDSIKVTAKAQITTGTGVITGTATYAGAAQTNGTSDAIADMTTWNGWQMTALATPQELTALQQLERASHFAFNLPKDDSTGDAIDETAETIIAMAECWVGWEAVVPCFPLAYRMGKLMFTGNVSTPPESVTPPTTLDPNNPNMDNVGIRDVLAGGYVINGTGEMQAPAPVPPTDQESINQQAHTAETQDFPRGEEGSSLSSDGSTQITIQNHIPIVIPAQHPAPVLTTTSGSSAGGAQTATHTDFQQYTTSQLNQFSSSQSWSSATAVDSAHAAELTFSYLVRNVGTDYARLLHGMAFSIFLGDDPDPIYTYYPAADFGGDGVLYNLLPGTANAKGPFDTRPIPLTLEQMRALDLGQPLRIVLVDYDFGDDQIFYQAALSNSVKFMYARPVADDPTGERFESVLVPIIPNGQGPETVQTVMEHFFPIETDANGNLISIATPNLENDALTFDVHAQSTVSWWSFYLAGLPEGVYDPQDMVVTPNTGVPYTVVMRFQQDRDRDGYSDVSERRLDTDPLDASSFPKPELLAGLYSITHDDAVTATLSFLNTGLYDGYGIKAMMLAPDDSISITDAVVGGAGRVRAQKQVIVGSRILGPDYPASTWRGTARPAGSGYYTGWQDRLYTFTVHCSTSGGCAIGRGSWNLAWNDGQGSQGTINPGDSYASPTPLNVGAHGLAVAFMLGTVFNGDQFTVKALAPRDTFHYTINREPHSSPIVVVTYNDPQGSHHFVIPPAAMTLSSPAANLSAFSGQMLPDPSARIITTAPLTQGANTVSLLVDNPTEQPISQGYLLAQMSDLTGTVVSRVQLRPDFPPGPSSQDVTFDTSDFSPAYDPQQEYFLTAYWTDYQGDPLGAVARPFSTFQADPKPAFVMAAADETWDFGTAQQGTLLQRTFTLGSVGHAELLTHLGVTSGMTVTGPTSRSLAPGDTATYTVTLNTQSLPTGAFAQTIPVLTSDPEHPTKTITVRGNITQMPAEALAAPALMQPDGPPAVTRTQSLAGAPPATQTLSAPEAPETSPDAGPSGGLLTDGPARNTQPLLLPSPGTDTGPSAIAGDYVWDFRSGSHYPWVSNGMDCDGYYGGNAFWVLNPSASGDPYISIDGLYEPNNYYYAIQVRMARLAGDGGDLWVKNTYDGWVWAGALPSIQNGVMQDVTLPTRNLAGWRDYIQALEFHPVNQGQPGAGCGNSSDLVQVEWVKLLHDDISPTISFSNPPINTWYNTDQNISWSVSDGQSGVAGFSQGWSDPGGCTQFPGATSGYLALSGAGEGMHSVHVRACDNSGLQTYQTVGWFGLDLTVPWNPTAPANPNCSAGNGAWQNACSDANFTWGGAGDAVSGVAGYYYSWGTSDTADPATWTTSAGFDPGPVPSNSTYYLRVKTRDNAGNVSSPTTLFVLRYDGTAPNNPTAPANPGCTASSGVWQNTCSDANFTWSGASDAASGVQGYYYYWGTSSSGDPTTWTTSAGFNPGPIPSNSTYYLRVKTRDNAGNISSPRTLFVLQYRLPVRTRFLRLPVRPGGYSSVKLGIQFGNASTPAGTLAFTADVGADGNVDFSYPGTGVSYPVVIAVDSAAVTDAFNTYLASRSGEVDVPIRIVPDPPQETILASFSATPSRRPDISIGGGDVVFDTPSPTETDRVTITASLHNGGTVDSGPLTASFYATPAGGTPWYVGSTFVDNVSAAGTVTAPVQWDTAGFTGTVSVRVVVDPYQRVIESNETNNDVTTTLTIRTRSDLHVTQIALSDDEPTAGETTTATVTLRNHGQTAAAASTLALFDGNPDAGGTQVGARQAPALAGGAQTDLIFAWTPTTAGLYQLFASADSDRQVNESDEGNNDAWRDLYVGFHSPILIDSGLPSSDVAYTPVPGYGAVDEGQPDVTAICDAGGSPAETLRRDPDGRVIYRFDNLLPGHFYHLDTTLYECDGAQRQETIRVDGDALVGPVSLSDAQVHRFSTRLDPAFYANRTISVTVEAPGINGAVTSALNLHDVDYRYADAGASSDLAYSASRSYGWLDGVATNSWGSLPYQNVRVNQSGNGLRYRYDSLAAASRYQVNLTLYQGDAVNVIEEVLIDGLATGVLANLSDRQPHYLAVDVPVETYREDGSIAVTVRRTNGTTGAFVNEIALEEKTLLTLPIISDLQVTNVTGEGATISWLTEETADGAVHYGTTTALGGIALDERGSPVNTRTHQITLVGLAAETTYSFYAISSDAIDDNAGAYHQFTTGPAFDPGSPDLAFGKVLRSDGSTLAAGALVRAKLRDADAQGSPGDSVLRSALVDASGYWSLDLAATRTTDTRQLFDYSLTGDQLILDVTDGAGCTASLTVDTGLDAPAPDIILVCPTEATHPIANGWTLLGLSVQSDPAPTAEAALDDVVAQGGGAIEIERWWNGGWDAHVRNLPFNNFTLELGRGYFVRANAASSWTRTGLPPAAPLPLHLYPGWNLVGLPRLTGTLLAEDLLADIATHDGACTEIDRWVNGGWVGHPLGYPVNNFTLTTTEGYFVKCTRQSTYTPGATTRASSGPAQPPKTAKVDSDPARAPTIYDVMVTNLRDVAFSVTWRTDQPGTGWLAYQTGAGPQVILQDERGAGVVSTLHQVTVTDLDPEMTYVFSVHSGESVAERDTDGRPFQAVTLATTAPGMPLTAFGQVLGTDGQPASDALVRAWLLNTDNTRSTPLSALVASDGYWALSLPAEACGEKQLLLQAFGPYDTTAEGTTPACAENVQPAPALTLQPGPLQPVYLPLVLR